MTAIESRRRSLHVDPLPWLLEPSTPAVRHVALRDLLDRSAGIGSDIDDFGRLYRVARPLSGSRALPRQSCGAV
jgi:hypothetical protein